MKFNIWQSTNNGLWCVTFRQGLTAVQAAEQLAEVVEAEEELRKTRPGLAVYEIRPERTNDETR